MCVCVCACMCVCAYVCAFCPCVGWWTTYTVTHRHTAQQTPSTHIEVARSAQPHRHPEPRPHTRVHAIIRLSATKTTYRSMILDVGICISDPPRETLLMLWFESRRMAPTSRVLHVCRSDQEWCCEQVRTHVLGEERTRTVRAHAHMR